jgi:hypothetical protein
VSAFQSRQPAPVVFLCHASEDKALGRRLATDLLAQGVKVFFDEWEIGPGDSIRQKIDQGLCQCTHFVALLTPTSLLKPWVNAEMDAAFVQKVIGNAKFIPLRAGLSADQLPPLLSALHSPTIDDYTASLPRLISSIYGISQRPALGAAPAPIVKRTMNTGLSAAAEAVVRLMVSGSQQGRQMDPQLSADDLRLAGLCGEDIEDAVDELERSGLTGHLSDVIYPQEELFIRFDKLMHPWDAEQDALRIAADLVNGDSEFLDIVRAACAYGWQPRRMNPALAFLASRGLGHAVRAMHPEYSVVGLRRTPATRRFVRDNS